jgi:chromosome segregation ATPase
VPSAANILRERELHIEKLDQEISLKNQTIADLAADRDSIIEISRSQKKDLDESNRWAAQLGQELQEAGAGIRKLQKELAQQAQGYEAKIAELEEDNHKKAEWAIETERRLTGELAARSSELAGKCRELADKCRELAHCVDVLHEVEKTVEERTAWAQSLESQIGELVHRIDELNEVEKTVEERTTWARSLESQVRELEAQLSHVRELESHIRELESHVRDLESHGRELEAQLSMVRGSRWMKLGNALGLGPPLRDG